MFWHIVLLLLSPLAALISRLKADDRDRQILALRQASGGWTSSPTRLALFVLAYNLGNFLRRLVLPPEMARWSLTTLREKLVKIGARLTRHARRLVLQMVGGRSTI